VADTCREGLPDPRGEPFRIPRACARLTEVQSAKAGESAGHGRHRRQV